MPAALASVSRTIIRKWEHRMIRWMDAYRSDLGPKEAQRFVRAFSSTLHTNLIVVFLGLWDRDSTGKTLYRHFGPTYSFNGQFFNILRACGQFGE